MDSEGCLIYLLAVDSILVFKVIIISSSSLLRSPFSFIILYFVLLFISFEVNDEANEV